MSMSRLCSFCSYLYALITSQPIIFYEQVPYDLDDHVEDELCEDYEKEQLLPQIGETKEAKEEKVSELEMTLSPYVTADSSDSDSDDNEVIEDNEFIEDNGVIDVNEDNEELEDNELIEDNEMLILEV